MRLAESAAVIEIMTPREAADNGGDGGERASLAEPEAGLPVLK